MILVSRRVAQRSKGLTVSGVVILYAVAWSSFADFTNRLCVHTTLRMLGLPYVPFTR